MCTLMSRKTVGGDKVLQSTNNLLRCYTCNRKGHLMRNCPFSAVRGQRPFSASFEANSTGMCDELCCIGTQRSQTAPVPDKIRTGRHLILLRITMVVCTCFTDTGSEVTLINKCMKEKFNSHSFHPSSRTLRGASGHSIRMLQNVNLFFQLSEITCYHNVDAVSGNVSFPDILLGMD